MSTFSVTRTSRKLRRCSNCRERIEPGQRYERHTMTSGDEMNDGQAWRTSIAHVPADCPLVTGRDQ